MRAGVSSTVQQTLTPEAANILKRSVAEACNRGHAQATPLHVAATMLVAPSSPLRRACLQTHQHPSHLPHCRALELCFNIALERLQAAPGPLPGGQPSYSNALVAALKRAQAHQRRGCPEQQQQPLLAVKVELEQLVISILDDPSVSRVMREAGFNSTDVKSHLEEMASRMAAHHSVTQSVTDSVRLPLGAAVIDQIGFRLGGTPSIFGGFTLPHHLSPYTGGGLSQESSDIQLHIRPLRTHSPYINPVLLKPGGTDSLLGGGNDSRHVLDVLMRKRKRNPVLVGDSAVTVLRDVMQHLERGDVPEQLQGVRVVSAKLSFTTLMNASEEDLHARFVELNNSVRELIPVGGAVVDLGDLQWLLKLRPPASQLSGFCPVQYAVYEIKELFSQHQDSGCIWLIGTATTHTYLSFQVLYPDLENHWELQPLPVGATGQSSLSSRFRMQEAGVNGTDSSLALSLLPSPVTVLKLSSLDGGGGEQLTCCSDCMTKYEKEVLLLREQERLGQSDSPQSCSSSVETPSKVATVDQDMQSASTTQPVLPLWLQKALPNGSTNMAASVAASIEAKDKILPLAQRLRELQKKWNQTCQSLHAEHVPCLNVSLETQQQPSPSSSQISGGTLGRCQEGAFSLLRDNSTQPGSARATVGLYPAMNGKHPPREMASSLPISIFQNGLSDHPLQAIAHKERVQENSTGCSPSKSRLPWQAPAAGARKTPSTEAAAPCFASDSEQRGNWPGISQQMDADALSQLCKGLIKRVGWQPGVISIIANTVMQCRSGLGKQRGVSFKGDSWILFLGYDRPGKRQMAEALAELIYGEEKKPICLTFGGQQDVISASAWSLGLTVPCRGRMPLDQLAEAVRHNPSSVVLLEDLEQADSMFRSSLLSAMEKGRLVDSSGRDVSFNNVIVLMTSSIGTDSIELKCTGLQMQSAKKSHASDSIARRQSGMKDSGCSANNPYPEDTPEQQSSCKRKGDWDADDASKMKVLGCQNKKSNRGRALDLDLNMSAEENETADSSVSHAAAHQSCEVEGFIRPEFSEEEVLSSARKHLGEFCDLVDAVVVFCFPL